jgi:F-type H+-transporting ATPase subunit a
MISKINTSRISHLVLALIFTFFSMSGFGQDPTENHEATISQAHDAAAPAHDAKPKSEGVDISKVAFEHILDSHSWHFWGEGHDAVVAPLPVIIYSNTKGLQCFSSAKFEHGHASYNGYSLEEEVIKTEDPNETIYDFSITKNVTQMFISMILLLWLFISIANAYKKTGITSAPSGKQSFFEPLIVFVRDDIAKENIGGKKYERFVPYLLTVFFLILINNVLGLIPISANLTGNIAFTLVLAVVTMLVTNFNGSGTYWKHIFAPKPAALWLILMPIELVGVFSKPFALMIRLFANIAGGHIVVISLIGLIFIFESYAIAPVSIALTLFIDILECLVALLQAYIFTMLTALFIGSAMEDHSHGHEGAEGVAEHH